MTTMPAAISSRPSMPANAVAKSPLTPAGPVTWIVRPSLSDSVPRSSRMSGMTSASASQPACPMSIGTITDIAWPSWDMIGPATSSLTTYWMSLTWSICCVASSRSASVMPPGRS